jgi:hypothetical protein
MCYSFNHQRRIDCPKGHCVKESHQTVTPAAAQSETELPEPAGRPTQHNAAAEQRPESLPSDSAYPEASAVLGQLLHDIRSPLASIGLVSEMVSSHPAALPRQLLSALGLHYSELIRHFTELEIFVSDALGLDRLPAHAVSLADILDVALVQAGPYVQRRRQSVARSGSCEHTIWFPEQYLKQVLLVVLYDVSLCADEGADIAVGGRRSSPFAHVTLTAPLTATIQPEVLLIPRLRGSAELNQLRLTSLAAYADLVSSYGGRLGVAARKGQMVVSLDLPLA